VTEELIANDLQRFFVKIFYIRHLSDDQKINLFKEIRENPSRYVLKPMKEGGGNNFFNEDIINLLPEDDNLNNLNEILINSIFMERINPPEVDSIFLINEKCKKVRCVGEISVWGSILSEGDKIINNESFGFIFRTKDKSFHEGGVSSGYVAHDLPCLVD
jgi:glutathione synthase